MDRKTREELNDLSMECFGTSSRWQKIVNNGVLEPMERDREVLVPQLNGRLVKKVFTDKKTFIKSYTVEEVKKLMLDILEDRKKFVKVIDASKTSLPVVSDTTLDSTGQSLFKLLFNEGETVCVSNNEFGYHSIPLENALSDRIALVSPDMQTQVTYCKSTDLILVALNPIKGWRRDVNTTAFRSYLVELDVGSIKEQLGTIEHFKMPFSIQVFSGNKSVITLDEDLPDEKTYRMIGNWIFNIVNMCDPNCKNPSRSVRIPGAYRGPGKKQRLIKLNGRISHKDLFDWLGQYEHLRPKVREKKPIPEGEADYSRLSG